jgi:pimeloyl-ACP methyl ester carboxylesterase
VTTPYDALRPIATQQVTIGPRLEHIELYTLGGLLSMFWHWPDPPAGDDPAGVVICGGGAMGGVLGPADGLYHDLGTTLAADHGIALVRVSWRQPNELDECTLDALAALQLATRRGAPKAVMVGHSFGGAVAVRAGVAADELVAGVVTLATQSAGCEVAEGLVGRPVLCIHGRADELLPVACSEVVAELAGGELVVLPGAGHLLRPYASELHDRLVTWIGDVFA